ncbi:MAG TPA: Spy/CpxP family protein refolding chaperone [Candidatus Eisenbacteria bacterium]|nr:Spy/CpxP family protein refolding chaperone [Candidatus Eisenbacteria bacterium]
MATLDVETRRNLPSILAVTSFVVGVTATLPALGRQTHDDGGIGAGAFFGTPSALHALDLTADQRHSVQSVLRTHTRALHQLAADDKAAKRAIEDRLLGPGDLSEQDLDPLVQQELEIRSELVRARVTTALDVRKELTPEQVEQVASLRDGFRVPTKRVRTNPMAPG